jgi:alkanesulfonate monooxygenase SsuD/methylene tetrahydromethanopterin reductase-like flavin-dependent oxidoreductase (luciferase family)
LLQAARRGLPYLASPLEPLAVLEENHAIYRDNLPASARPGRPVVPIMRTVHVAGDSSEAKRILAGLEAEGARMRSGAGRLPKSLARAAAAPAEERAIVGVESSVIDQLASHRERLGMNLLITRPQVEGISAREREASLERLAAICQSQQPSEPQ